jgi:drug/metabolite transporter (DMT)-like permease
MIQFVATQHSQRTASLMVFVASSLWGLLWVPMRLTESMGVAPLWVQFWFTTMPALFLACLCLRSTLRERENWTIYLMSGICIGMGYTLYAVGLLVGSVSKTTVLFYLTPIWSTLLGMFFLAERPSLRRWGAIAMATLGCCLVMQINPVEMRLAPVDMLGLLSGVFWGMGTVVLRRYPDIDYRNATFAQYLSGTLITAVAILFLAEEAPELLATGKAAAMGAVFGILVFMSSFLMIIRIMQYMSPGRVGILMLSEALVAVISAMIFLGETLSMAQWIGVTVILTAGVVVALTDDVVAEAETS